MKNKKENQSKDHRVVINKRDDDECPVKEGDNCKVPGAYNDSAPIGGGG